jgi:uncharacterized protein (TIGR04168 family)
MLEGVRRESVMVKRASESVIKIAVVGDVHDQWDGEDGAVLQHLGVDLVLFVGDFGNESLPVVRAIAALAIPKAVVLGNHDAWYTATDWGRKKCPYDRTQEDRVQQQLDLLGETHVGYSKLDFPELGLTVVGARPFSWGGSEWKYTDFYSPRYGVASFAESTTRIVEAATQAATGTVIFIGHNGPLGLGHHPEDPCGRDWQPLGGDHGDPDFAAAIAQTRQLDKAVPLVTFGHMHHSLRHTKQRLRTPLSVDQGTVYLNAASVPRIIHTETGWQRNFSLVYLHQQTVLQASLVWVDQTYSVIAEQVLYEQPVVERDRATVVR